MNTSNPHTSQRAGLRTSAGWRVQVHPDLGPALGKTTVVSGGGLGARRGLTYCVHVLGAMAELTPGEQRRQEPQQRFPG